MAPAAGVEQLGVSGPTLEEAVELADGPFRHFRLRNTLLGTGERNRRVSEAARFYGHLGPRNSGHLWGGRRRGWPAHAQSQG